MKSFTIVKEKEAQSIQEAVSGEEGNVVNVYENECGYGQDDSEDSTIGFRSSLKT